MLVLACCACDDKTDKEGDDPAKPVVKIGADLAKNFDSITFSVTASDADECRYLCVEGEQAAVTAEEILSTGTTVEPGKAVTLSNLKADTWYTLAVAAKNAVKTSDAVFQSVRTLPDETPDVIAADAVFEADYFPDSDADGVGNYYLVFGNATAGPDETLSDGYAFVLDIYGAAAAAGSEITLPAGSYDIQLGGKGMNQIDMATSGVKQFDASADETYSSNFTSGTIVVSYENDLCTIHGVCTAGEENMHIEFEYTGGLVFQEPEDERLQIDFTSVNSADYWGDTWGAGTGNYEIEFTDDQGHRLILNLNDIKPIKDELLISPGTYVADFDETGEAGHFIAGGTDMTGDPFGTCAIVDDVIYLIDGGTVTVAYDAGTQNYTFGMQLESSGGLSLDGTYAGPLAIEGHGVSTDKIDAVLTYSDDSSNQLYYDGADTEGYSQFTLVLQSADDASPSYSFSFDLYCPNSAIDTTNPSIPEQTYIFDAPYAETGDGYTYQYGCTYDWTMLEYRTELDDGSFYFKSGDIKVSRIPAGYRIEANLTEEEIDMPVRLVYEGPVSWDASGLPENSPAITARHPRILRQAPKPAVVRTGMQVRKRTVIRTGMLVRKPAAVRDDSQTEPNTTGTLKSRFFGTDLSFERFAR